MSVGAAGCASGCGRVCQWVWSGVPVGVVGCASGRGGDGTVLANCLRLLELEVPVQVVLGVWHTSSCMLYKHGSACVWLRALSAPPIGSGALLQSRGSRCAQ